MATQCEQQQLTVDRLRADEQECQRDLDNFRQGCLDEGHDPEFCMEEIRARSTRCREITTDRQRAEAALANCQAGLPPAGPRSEQGHVNFLDVRHVGTFGPDDDFIRAHVIFRVQELFPRSFGFRLDNNDPLLPIREAQLQLLRDAFANDYLIQFDYVQQFNHENNDLGQFLRILK
jgi:hypothetical protein